MLSRSINSNKVVLLIAVCLCASFTGCGNTCVVAFSVNGNGGVIVKAGDPPPSCTLNQAQGMVRAALATVASCDTCAPVAQVQHMVVVLRGVQIHSSLERDSDGWIDIAPELATKPRTLDLVTTSLSELSVASAVVPAGTYDAIRLQLVAAGIDSNQVSSDANDSHCGRGTVNCLVMGDGRIQPINLSDDASALSISLTDGGEPLLVLPDTTSELHIHLGVRQLAGIHARLFGQVVAQRVNSAN